MIKNLLTLAAVLLLISCEAKKRNNNMEEDYMVEEEVVEQPYETVDSEEQAEEINEQTEAEIQEQVEEVEVQDRVFFAYDSAQLTSAAKEILDVQSQWLKSDTSIKITIEGHCDERGTREYNIALGEKRANSAKNYLISKGVDSSRIKTISYGKERPAFFGNTEAIFAKNRRAVTVVN